MRCQNIDNNSENQEEAENDQVEKEKPQVKSTSSRPLAIKYKVRNTQNSTKALVTTLMILGTYLICWMPALTFYALTCIDGCPFPLFQIAFSTRIVVSFVNNCLVVAKALIDPLIYTCRMKEIKNAFKSIFARRNAWCRNKYANSTLTRATN
ncbi:hypothetical protein B4U79_01653, partial [Dinothrombium tinctorium]